jgi:Protein of unknown function (DUF4233)
VTAPAGRESLPPRTRKAVHGMFAATLCLEALMVLFVPRAIARSGSGLTHVRLSILLGLVVLLIAAVAFLGRRWGLAFATALQVAVIACGLLTWAMWFLGGIFTAIWIYELRVRAQLITRWAQVREESPTGGPAA